MDKKLKDLVKKETESYYQKVFEQENAGSSDAKGNIYKSLGDISFSDLQYAKADQYYNIRARGFS